MWPISAEVHPWARNITCLAMSRLGPEDSALTCPICGSEMEIERVDAGGVDVVCTAPECSYRARYDAD